MGQMNPKRRFWREAKRALTAAGFVLTPHESDRGVTVWMVHPETGKRTSIASLEPELHIHCEHARLHPEPEHYGWCSDCSTQESER